MARILNKQILNNTSNTAFSKVIIFSGLTQVTFTCSKSTIKALEKGVKYFQG